MVFNSAADAKVRRRQHILVGALIRKVARIRQEASGEKKPDEEGKGTPGFDEMAAKFTDALEDLIKQRPDMLQIRDDKLRKKMKKRVRPKEEKARMEQEWRLAKDRAKKGLQEMRSHPDVDPPLQQKRKCAEQVDNCMGDEKKEKKIKKKFEKGGWPKRWEAAEDIEKMIKGWTDKFEDLALLPGEEMAEEEMRNLNELQKMTEENKLGLNDFLGEDAHAGGPSDKRGKGGGKKRGHLKKNDVFGDDGGGGAASPAHGGGGQQTEEERQQILQMEQEQKEVTEAQEQVLAGIINSLGQLREKAYIIKDQIQESNIALDKAGKKIDDCHEGIKGLNERTGKILEQQSCNSWYTYAACFLLLLAIMGVVVIQMDLVPQT